MEFQLWLSPEENGFHNDCLFAAKPPAMGRPKIVNYSSCVIFLSWERPTPARLLHLLLLMAGIESNPGPSSTLPSHDFSTASKSVP